MDTKYIMVTGGVISGIGKGVIASSLGTILKACGVSVTSIKIDPYLNIGTHPCFHRVLTHCTAQTPEPSPPTSMVC